MPARCATLADSLVDVDVLDPGEPLRFVHPLVRSAIYNDIPTVRRGGLHALAAQGRAIVMISSELPEVLRMSHRILVMCEGRVTGEIPALGATQEQIMQLATQRESMVSSTVH